MSEKIVFEYLNVWADKRWMVSTDIRQGKHTYLDRRMGLTEYLNFLGQDGWELISVLPMEVGYRAFLKRRQPA